MTLTNKTTKQMITLSRGSKRGMTLVTTWDPATQVEGNHEHPTKVAREHFARLYAQGWR